MKNYTGARLLVVVVVVVYYIQEPDCPTPGRQPTNQPWHDCRGDFITRAVLLFLVKSISTWSKIIFWKHSRTCKTKGYFIWILNLRLNSSLQTTWSTASPQVRKNPSMFCHPHLVQWVPPCCPPPPSSSSSTSSSSSSSLTSPTSDQESTYTFSHYYGGSSNRREDPGLEPETRDFAQVQLRLDPVMEKLPVGHHDRLLFSHNFLRYLECHIYVIIVLLRMAASYVHRRSSTQNQNVEKLPR